MNLSRLRIKGNWKVIKGKVKSKYVNLVDDDDYRSEPNGEEQPNVGRMLKRLGKAQDQEDILATIEKYCC